MLFDQLYWILKKGNKAHIGVQVGLKWQLIKARIVVSNEFPAKNSQFQHYSIEIDDFNSTDFSCSIPEHFVNGIEMYRRWVNDLTWLFVLFRVRWTFLIITSRIRQFVSHLHKIGANRVGTNFIKPNIFDIFN